MNNDEIKQEALHLPKTTKREAIDAINRLVDNEGKDPVDLKLLYAYLMPPPHKVKTALGGVTWVGQALDTSNNPGNHKFLRYLFEGFDKLMATDGHRAHWITQDDPALNRGFLDPQTLLPTSNVVARDGANFEKFLDMPEPNVTFFMEDIKISISTIGIKLNRVYELPNGSRFNAKYIDEALDGSRCFSWYNKTPKGSPLYLQAGEHRHAVIMPLV